MRPCSPCAAHPSEVLTADEWAAFDELYGDSHWSGYSLIEQIERALEREDTRRGDPTYRHTHDYVLGQEAIFEWLGVRPLDMVTVVRHVRKYTEGDEVPDCVRLEGDSAAHGDADRASRT